MIVRVPGHLARPASPKWHCIDDEIDDYEDMFETSQFGPLVVNSQILS